MMPTNYAMHEHLEAKASCTLVRASILLTVDVPAYTPFPQPALQV
jgi:hypothetical protein